MTARLGIREGALSAIVFGAILFALVSVDPRVKLQMSETFRGVSVSAWTDRASDLANALWSAARTQSLDNAPLLVFATVGIVLTVFMLRS
jgi:hypothetical protein